MFQFSLPTLRYMRNEKLESLAAAGYLHMMDPVSIYAQSKNLANAEIEYKRELIEVEHPSRNPIIISRLAITLARILEAQDKLDEAEQLLVSLPRRTTNDPSFPRPDQIFSRGLETFEFDELNVISHDLAKIYQLQGKYQQAIQLCHQVLNNLKKKTSMDHPQYQSVLLLLANIYMSEEKFEEAEKAYYESFQHHKRLFGPFHPQTLIPLENVAIAKFHRRDYDGAEAIFAQIQARDKRVKNVRSTNNHISEHRLAMLLSQQGHYKAAEIKIKSTLQGVTDLLGPSSEYNPLRIECLSSLPTNFGRQSQWQSAEPIHRKLLDLCVRRLGKVHPATLKSLNDLLFSLQMQDKFAEAEQLTYSYLEGVNYEEINHVVSLRVFQLSALYFLNKSYGSIAQTLYELILTVKVNLLGSTDYSTLASRHDLLTILLDLDKPAEAETASRPIIQELEKANLHSEYVVEFSSILAAALEMQHKYVESADEYSKVPEKSITLYGGDDERVLSVRSNLAILLQVQGKLEDAVTMQRLVTAKFVANFGMDDERTLTSMTNLGASLAAQGQLAEAKAQLSMAIDGLDKLSDPDHPLRQRVVKKLAAVQERIVAGYSL